MRRGCVVLMVAATMAAGCGSKAKTASHSAGTSPASTPTTSASTPSTASSTDCNVLGINPEEMHEGTCTHAGVTYVIMDENHTLKLHTLWAKLSRIETAVALPVKPAQGQFVLASVTVTNRLELPQTFDAGGTQQAGLILEGTVYKEDTGAELSDLASCAHRHVRIASEKSETCDVVFDVPASAAADIGKHGSGDLYIVDFGSDLAGSISPQTVGQIRLYG